ncbi:MAG: succinylglutamate desuccinylase/aspartoacylase family protein [Burkholderiales bacterium]|nr:succinylglutamate desuccinylase/aspartoacylase family protein [Nitrosomonas sp.]MCP5274588.1 succinylglutamate desuccinylase/aspartoacylase family protein [Burkholderiales bacterium]
MLAIRQDIPEGLLDLQSHELYKKLDGPTLFQLSGRRKPPIFVSVLLHGNEPVGWDAIRHILYQFQSRELPRSLSLFVGNIEAARFHRRHLEKQPDFNRIWPGCAETETPEHRMAKQVFDVMTENRVFASIDVHNNTGLNPHYACVNKLETPFLQLATLFDRTVIFFTRPKGVQSLAFSKLAPSVTLECGQPGNPQGVAHALEYLTACLNLAEIPMHAVAKNDIELFHTVAVVRIAPGVEVGFQEEDLDLRLIDNIDHLNFRELPFNTLIGWQKNHQELVLRTADEQDQEISDHYFHLDGNALRISRPVMPSMLTRNTQVIHQDCLCYLMERLAVPDSVASSCE